MIMKYFDDDLIEILYDILFQLMLLQGSWGPLIIAGIFASTLSSASGCLIGAPRVFQVHFVDRRSIYSLSRLIASFLGIMSRRTISVH